MDLYQEVGELIKSEFTLAYQVCEEELIFGYNRAHLSWRATLKFFEDGDDLIVEIAAAFLQEDRVICCVEPEILTRTHERQEEFDFGTIVSDLGDESFSFIFRRNFFLVDYYDEEDRLSVSAKKVIAKEIEMFGAEATRMLDSLWCGTSGQLTSPEAVSLVYVDTEGGIT